MPNIDRKKIDYKSQHIIYPHLYLDVTLYTYYKILEFTIVFIENEPIGKKHTHTLQGLSPLKKEGHGLRKMNKLQWEATPN